VHTGARVLAEAARSLDQRLVALGHAQPHDAHAGGRFAVERRQRDHRDAGLIDEPLGEFDIAAVGDRRIVRQLKITRRYYYQQKDGDL